MRAGPAFFVRAGITCILLLPAPVSAQRSHDPCAAEKEREESYPPIVLHDLKFDGKLTIPESDLQEFVSDVMQRKLYADHEWFDRIAEEARGLWQSRGYFKVLLDDPEPQIFSIDSAGHHAFLTIRVTEGPKYRLKDIHFRKDDVAESDVEPADARPALRKKNAYADQTPVGANPRLAFPEEELRRLVPLQDGDILRVDQIREGLDALKKLYGAYGYINLVVSPNTEVNDEKRLVAITMELDEGRPFRIGRVESQNHDPALDRALQQAFPSGTLFSNDAWEAGIKTLLPNFLPQQASLRKDEANGTVDITIDTRTCALPDRLASLE
jgi:outer membrane protein assembly factor BamA